MIHNIGLLLLGLALLSLVLAMWQSQMRGTLSPKLTVRFGIFGVCTLVLAGAILAFGSPSRTQDELNSKQIIPAAKQSNSIEHFSKSMALTTQANKALLDSGTENKKTSVAEAKAIVENYKIALAEAKRVNTSELNQQYTALGDHYRDEFLLGLELIVSGFEDNDSVKFEHGGDLLNKWGEWYEKNYDAITQ